MDTKDVGLHSQFTYVRTTVSLVRLIIFDCCFLCLGYKFQEMFDMKDEFWQEEAYFIYR